VGADSGDVDNRPTAEPRQRWRIVFRRSADAPEGTHREVVDPWLARLTASGLPLTHGGGRPRPPLSFAAPMPLGVPVERDLADLILAERLPVHYVRARVESTLPDGIAIVDMHDVWLGVPPLAASVAAADYRVTFDAADGLRPALDRAAVDLLRASSLPRERTRGASLVSYDLRPLLADIRVGNPPLDLDEAAVEAPRVTIHVRTLFHPERGTGRPEEVVAALGERISRQLEPEAIVRERLILADELDPSPPPWS
jgi:radical SAM-linked protein